MTIKYQNFDKVRLLGGPEDGGLYRAMRDQHTLGVEVIGEHGRTRHLYGECANAGHDGLRRFRHIGIEYYELT